MKALLLLFFVLLVKFSSAQTLYVGVWNNSRKLIDTFRINDTIITSRNLSSHFKNKYDSDYYLQVLKTNEIDTRFVIPYPLGGDWGGESFLPQDSSAFIKNVPRVLDSLPNGQWFGLRKEEGKVIVLLEKNIRDYKLNGTFKRYNREGNLFSMGSYKNNEPVWFVFFKDKQISSISFPSNNGKTLLWLESGVITNAWELSEQKEEVINVNYNVNK